MQPYCFYGEYVDEIWNNSAYLNVIDADSSGDFLRDYCTSRVTNKQQQNVGFSSLMLSN